MEFTQALSRLLTRLFKIQIQIQITNPFGFFPSGLLFRDPFR